MARRISHAEGFGSALSRPVWLASFAPPAMRQPIGRRATTVESNVALIRKPVSLLKSRRNVSAALPVLTLCPPDRRFTADSGNGGRPANPAATLINVVQVRPIQAAARDQTRAGGKPLLQQMSALRQEDQILDRGHGGGQIITLEVPRNRLRAVNLAIENGALGAFRTEFYRPITSAVSGRKNAPKSGRWRMRSRRPPNNGCRPGRSRTGQLTSCGLGSERILVGHGLARHLSTP